MYRTLTLTTSIIGAVLSQAQPVLTLATNAPVPGTSFVWSQGGFLDPGPGGADAIWDMSGLVTSTFSNIDLVDPTTLPGHEFFVGATVAAVEDGMALYFQADADGVYQLGMDDGQGWRIVYDDKGTYLQFPCTYLTSWTDEASATYTSEGSTIERTVTIDADADGYGTLILPGGNVEDVLRVHWQEVIVDASELFTMTITNDSYLFYVQGEGYPLVQTVSSIIEMMGMVTTEEFTQWRSDISTYITSAEDRSAFSVIPNPATDRVEVLSSGAPVRIEMIDMGGRLAKTIDPRGDRQIIQVSDLERGAYMMCVTMADGRMLRQRVVLQ